MQSNTGTVHLVFKTHLDVGFTDYSKNVVSAYIEKHIPNAIKLAEYFRNENREERFIWTTGSWIVYEYLERASSEGIKKLEKAIINGDIVWHALPFTTHSELMDASLYEFGLSLSKELDNRFSKNTISAKVTDVPGHTRAIIPLLADAGIELLHIGINPASKPVDVPHVFRWRHNDNKEIVVVYDAGTYGGITNIADTGLSLAFEHAGDNIGLPSEDDVVSAYSEIKAALPDATIRASSLNSFALQLRAHKSKLPVVTGEMGDTWIHGVGSDPKKVSQFRELLRLRNKWLDERVASKDDKRFKDFSRSLLVVPEHTWGMDEKTHLADYEHYTADQLKNVIEGSNFAKFKASWAEQRTYITDAITALGNSDLAEEAKESLDKLTPKVPNLSGYEKVADTTEIFDMEHFEVRFHNETGAIKCLFDKKRGRDWASSDNLLAFFRYQTFSQEDYDRFADKYLVNLEVNSIWAIPDFTKPGIASTNCESKFWFPKLNALYHKCDEEAHHFIAGLSLKADEIYGNPKKIIIHLRFPHSEPAIYIDLQWFDKTATRLPEAMWFSFCPKVISASGWVMDKMGQPISPLEVISNGNSKLHCVNSGVTYTDEISGICIKTLDTPLVSPGAPSLLNFNNDNPDLLKGMHFNIYNNVWGTNFPMWYEEDGLARFMLIFDDIS